MKEYKGDQACIHTEESGSSGIFANIISTFQLKTSSPGRKSKASSNILSNLSL